MQSWSGKHIHGQYCHLTDQSPVDMKEAFGWLKAAKLSVATEGLMVAAQDQALWARYNEHHILYQHVSPTCHMCKAWRQLATLWQAVVLWHAPTDYTD